MTSLTVYSPEKYETLSVKAWDLGKIYAISLNNYIFENDKCSFNYLISYWCMSQILWKSVSVGDSLWNLVMAFLAGSKGRWISSIIFQSLRTRKGLYDTYVDHLLQNERSFTQLFNIRCDELHQINKILNNRSIW